MTENHGGKPALRVAGSAERVAVLRELEATQIARAHAASGLFFKTVFTLNGGALIAMLSFLGAAEWTAPFRPHIALSAAFFFVGLAITSAAFYVDYFLSVKELKYFNLYYQAEYKFQGDQDYKQYRDNVALAQKPLPKLNKIRRWNSYVALTALLIFVLGSASVLLIFL